MYRTLYCQIDFPILAENMRAIRAAVPPQTEVMAVVKANAYGHGLVPAAKIALENGASCLGVAIPEEGELLRHEGVKAPILVLGPVTPRQAEAIVVCHLTATVCNADMVHELGEICCGAMEDVDVHLKIDTGMGRIGARTREEIDAVLAALKRYPMVHLTGAYTHFADAENADSTFTQQQFDRFMELTEGLNVPRHCCNSTAMIRYPHMQLDMVRAGIALYGCPPCPTSIPLKPVMHWVTDISFVKEIQPGDSLSYGRTFTATAPMRVATLPVGYGDGYHRAISGSGGYVLIRGQRAPILGAICMDQMLVDITHIPQAELGDAAVLLGRQGDEEITAHMLGQWAGTISYEMLLAPTPRVIRREIGAPRNPQQWIKAKTRIDPIIGRR